MRSQGFRKAFEYRLEHLGTPIPEEYLSEEEKEALKNPLDTDTLETPAQAEHREWIQSLEGTPVSTGTPEPTGTPVSLTEEPKKEYTVDEVKAKLTEAGVKFHHMLGAEKIMELAVANNLI